MKKLSERVIGCAVQVSRTLGRGFLEKVYDNALAIELQQAGIPCQRQKQLTVSYRNQVVGDYACDFLIDGRLLVELKALSRLLPEHEAQVMNYLKATGLKVGLLLNFGEPKVGIRRIVLEYDETDPI